MRPFTIVVISSIGECRKEGYSFLGVGKRHYT
jgi:hypothetical protein